MLKTIITSVAFATLTAGVVLAQTAAPTATPAAPMAEKAPMAAPAAPSAPAAAAPAPATSAQATPPAAAAPAETPKEAAAANDCLKSALNLAQQAESKKMSNDELDKLEDMLGKMEGHCDANQAKEASLMESDIKAMIDAKK